MLAETKPRSPKAIAKLSDDRVLSAMTRAVFAGGFAWHIIDRKWPAFESAFQWLRPACLRLPERRAARRADARPQHHPQPAQDHGRAEERALRARSRRGAWQRRTLFRILAGTATFIDLNAIIRKRGIGFGFENAARFLRGSASRLSSRRRTCSRLWCGKGSGSPFIRQEGAGAIQAALNHWSAESGHDLTTLSRVLAMSGPMDADGAPTRQRRYLSRM